MVMIEKEYFIESSTLNELILWQVNYTSVKLFKNMCDCGGMLNVQKHIETFRAFCFHFRQLFGLTN